MNKPDTTTMHVAGLDLKLTRYPVIKGDTLQAWNAADNYLIEHFIQSFENNRYRRILVINDQFGAIECALLKFADINGLELEICNWTDSYIASCALESNLRNNELKKIGDFFKSVENINNKSIDIILMRIPKSMAYLDYQLDYLSSILNKSIPLIAAGMARDIHTSTLNQFEKYIGSTQTSLARKKARLIFSTLQKKEPSESFNTEKHIKEWFFQYQKINLHLMHYANVYSRNKMDPGGRLMIEYLCGNTDQNNQFVIDLGCGNGVVGLSYASLNPGAEILFVDESYMAIASAIENARENFPGQKQFSFKTDNCLESIKSQQADLILCNPPFHQQQTITDHIAWQMMKDAKRVLKSKGQLILVGNRHLKYHVKLKHLFGNVKTVLSNNKFVVLNSELSD